MGRRHVEETVVKVVAMTDEECLEEAVVLHLMKKFMLINVDTT